MANQLHLDIYQPVITFWKLAIEKLEQGVKYVFINV